MQTPTVKEEARRLLEQLPDTCTWDELMQRIYVHQSIEAGLADSLAGKTSPVDEVRARFNLQP